MKITARNIAVTFSSKDTADLERVSDIINDISKAVRVEDSLITEDDLVFDWEDVNNARDLIYCLTLGNAMIKDLNNEEEENN